MKFLACLICLCQLLNAQNSKPVLNDGSEVTFLEFTIPTAKQKDTLAISLSLEGTTDLREIAELKVTHLRRAGDRVFASTQSLSKTLLLQSPLSFPKGNHKFRLSVRTTKNANLLHRIAIQVSGFTTADGTKTNFPPSPRKPQRLAALIHKRGDHGCHTFRIPGIARANNGDLLAVADMRYNSRKDLQEHIDIGLRISKDGGQSWLPPRPIMDMGTFGDKPEKENGCSDPCILVDQATGEIMVAACWTHGKPNTHQWSGKGSEPGLGIAQSTQFMVVRSTDHGMTWSKPENWTLKLKNPAWYLFAPAPGNGITMRDGTLVMPTQGRDENGLPFSNIIWSGDHGENWHVSAPARQNTTECAVAELTDGSLMLNIRDNRNRKDRSDTNGRAVAVTSDLGKTWKRHATDHSALPEPVCMASLISDPYRPGTLYFSNPNSKNSRAAMTVRRSTDHGQTWSSAILLDSKGGAYSSLVMIDRDHLGILYESSVADMIFQKIALTDFVANPLTSRINPGEIHQEAPITRIAFGSCNNPRDKAKPIFDAVLNKKPDVFIFLGDNIYGDTRDMEVLKKKYQELEDVEDFRKLRDGTQILATWDDHDFGANDGGNTYPMRKESQEIFLDFFKDPANSPRRTREGIYASYSFGAKGKACQIILLDTRYFRDLIPGVVKPVGPAGWYKPTTDTTKTLLGGAQWKWLEAQLQVPADVRIIASSIQMISYEKGMENWGNVPHERKRLFDLLKKYHADHTFAISGDVHFAELSKLDIGGYPFYDLTSSGLSHTSRSWAGAPNSFRVGKSHFELNAGLIDINWENKSLNLQVFNGKGEPLIEHPIKFDELEFAR